MDAETWNEKYPVGVAVEYYPIRRSNGKFEGQPLITKTTTEALEMCGGYMVKIDKKAGVVSLDHLVVLPDKE